MGILGIENRTENWKTVQHFYGLEDDAKVRLVRRLLKPYGAESDIDDGHKVTLQLFWSGMRDFIDQCDENGKPTIKGLAGLYERLFPDIHEKMNRDFPRLRANYSVTSTQDKEKLFNNLRSTEVDIVLATEEYLFIGEAKHESDLGADGTHILVHQIVREYIMAKMLVHLITKPGSPGKKVIPFIVEGKKNLSGKHQVKFMQKRGWLKKGNILPWAEIAELVKG